MTTTLIEKNTTTLSIEKLEKAAFILKTIAHPIRLGVIELLDQNDELSVTDICEALKTEQSLTSHHLTGMKLKGILACRREGKNIYYSLAMREVLNVIACIHECSPKLK